MLCLQLIFLQFCSTTFYKKFYKICLLSFQLGTCHQFQAFQGFSWNNLISKDFVDSRFGDTNLVPYSLVPFPFRFHLLRDNISSICQEMLFKTAIMKHSVKFPRNHLWWSGCFVWICKKNILSWIFSR